MLVVHNDDTPGMIGRVTTVLGDAGVNISDMGVGRSPSGEAALMVMATDSLVPAECSRGDRRARRAVGAGDRPGLAPRGVGMGTAGAAASLPGIPATGDDPE